MKVYLVGKNDIYNGVGEWDGKTFVVLKGSKVKKGEPGNFKQMKMALKAWNDREIVDSKGNVLKDITFNSPSSAAQFITKRSINGWISWKNKDKKTLKELKG